MVDVVVVVIDFAASADVFDAGVDAVVAFFDNADVYVSIAVDVDVYG